jgi:hypothetical protein
MDLRTLDLRFFYHTQQGIKATALKIQDILNLTI